MVPGLTYKETDGPADTPGRFLQLGPLGQHWYLLFSYSKEKDVVAWVTNKPSFHSGAYVGVLWRAGMIGVSLL